MEAADDDAFDDSAIDLAEDVAEGPFTITAFSNVGMTESVLMV
ncbi:MAG: hypothetical protein AB8E87_10685 [Prochlorococcus sp.]|nr:hypothetical protein [Prochlorococcaceae cyanobacterium Fu_MAG_50]